MTNHSALMDGVYRRQRHFYDATRKFFLLGRDRLISELAPPPDARVLEIGCGTGRNMIVAARRYPQARFFGLDISAQMLETARESIARAGLQERITLAQADATDFDAQAMFGAAAFERVFFSYSLSMIPDWRAALAQGAAATAVGGALHVVDFGRQEGLPGVAKTVLRRWLALFHVAPRDGLDGALSDVAQAHGLDAPQVTPIYGGFAWLMRAQRPADRR